MHSIFQRKMQGLSLKPWTGNRGKPVNKQNTIDTLMSNIEKIATGSSNTQVRLKFLQERKNPEDRHQHQFDNQSRQLELTQ